MQCIFGYCYKYTQRLKTGFVIQGHKWWCFVKLELLYLFEWLRIIIIIIITAGRSP